jgi:hypothetical protein
LENSLTNEEADAKIAALEQQVQSAKTRLEAFKQGNVQVDQKQLAALYNEFKSLLVRLLILFYHIHMQSLNETFNLVYRNMPRTANELCVLRC